MIESPELVAGTGPSGSRTHIADSVRAGDLEALGASEVVAWFVARFPGCATVIRHADGGMAGLVGGAPLTAVAAETGPFPAALNRALDSERWGPAGAIGFALNTVLREQGYPDRPHGDSLLDDRTLRRVIELAHLSPDTTQSQIITDLHVSRATYFRLLRRARERILAHEYEVATT